MMRQYSAELGVLGCAKGPSSLCPMSARGAPAAASVSAEGPAMPLDPGARQCQLAARPPGRRSGFGGGAFAGDRKSTRLNSSHVAISYAVFCLKKKNKTNSEYQSSDRKGIQRSKNIRD